MSMKIGEEIKKTGKEITETLKEQTKPADTKGISTQFVGYVFSIPLSYAYDFLYNLVAKKVITNQLASDILKVIIPASVGGVFHFAKLPLGNIIAGTGYGIALLSGIKILIARFKGKKTTETSDSKTDLQLNGIPARLWGIE